MKKNDEEGMEVRVQMCCCGEWQFAGHTISWSHSIETGLLLLSVAHGEPDIDGETLKVGLSRVWAGQDRGNRRTNQLEN